MKLTITEKRKLVIDRLEKQLKSGLKPRKNGVSFAAYDINDVVVDDKGKPYAIKLSQKDRDRINWEIETLKKRI